MGFDARAVDSMSLWEFSQAAEGFRQANGTEDETAPLSETEHDRLMEKYA